MQNKWLNIQKKLRNVKMKVTLHIYVGGFQIVFKEKFKDGSWLPIYTNDFKAGDKIPKIAKRIKYLSIDPALL